MHAFVRVFSVRRRRMQARVQTRRPGRRCSTATLMLFRCSALQRLPPLLCSPLAQTVVGEGDTYKEGEGWGGVEGAAEAMTEEDAGKTLMRRWPRL